MLKGKDGISSPVMLKTIAYPASMHHSICSCYINIRSRPKLEWRHQNSLVHLYIGKEETTRQSNLKSTTYVKNVIKKLHTYVHFLHQFDKWCRSELVFREHWNHLLHLSTFIQQVRFYCSLTHIIIINNDVFILSK